ncbi:MAG: helix-turn-helix domain-containing protein [Bacteroidetes bacterium]|nr:helix-turn-helix domain-containing protein [Bacteroidota bacterium]
MELHEKIFAVLDHLNITAYRAAKELGTSDAVLSKIKKGQTPSAKLLESIVQVYNVNPMWLMTGKGEMFLSTALQQVQKNIEKINSSQGYRKAQELSITNDPNPVGELDQRIITIDQKDESGANVMVIDTKAAAGWPGNINNNSFYNELPQFKLPLFRLGDYALIQIRGDSMEPTIYNGDWLLTSQIHNFDDIREGYVYAVLLSDGFVVKRVLNRVQKRGALALRSDNETYSTYDVKVTEILQIWKVEMKWSAVLKNPKDDIREELKMLRTDMDMLINHVIMRQADSQSLLDAKTLKSKTKK